MFINDEVIHDVDLADKEKQLAKAFIKGAVYSWLNNQGEKAFSVRTLFGGDNGDWTGTPLQPIWERHKKLGKNNDEAYEQSAKDVGWLLKAVLDEDTIRKYVKQPNGYVNYYSWVK